MKAILFSILIFFSFPSLSQNDSLVDYWNDLSKQFLYRAEVVKDFAAAAQVSKFADTTCIKGINEVHRRLNQKLKNQQFVDSLLVMDIAFENDNLIGFLSRLLVQLENHRALRSKEEFKKFQASIMGAENRIFVKQKVFNEYCEVTGRKDLFYKRKS